MAKVSFSYQISKLPPSQPYPEGITLCRPTVPATIVASNKQSLRCLVLMDSGADACLIPLTFAELLNIDLLGLPRAMTVGVGSRTNGTFYDQITIGLGDGIEFECYAGFTRAMDAIGIGLLGQSGFFENYNVDFLHSQKRITVEKN